MVNFRYFSFLLLAPGVLSAAMKCTNCPEPDLPPPPPPPAPHPSSWTECVQEWFGTSPFCAGSCPSGWRQIRRSATADYCQASTPDKIIHCSGTSTNSCWSGTKVLCEGECVGVIQQA